MTATHDKQSMAWLFGERAKRPTWLLLITSVFWFVFMYGEE